ncbi:MAG: DNA polymerase zeta [Sclerophora amabilis]|nr:MAG: DNA polymerase zeta [Sclerophora amabilis]
MELFRVRLNCVDHYQGIPSHFDPPLFTDYDGLPPKDKPRVPVIRVFGATQTGQKVCAHIHGALPYLYIEYEGGLGPEEVDAYVGRLHLSIDHALGVSYRRNPYDGKSRFIGRITLVKGIPFYGYHVGYKFFLKIYVLNPLHVTRLSDLLRQGSVMKRVFQPYESHLQYLLQWMCDFNLYGCGYIDCDKFSFRGPVPEYDEMSSSFHLWHNRSIPASQISNEDRFPKQSHCSLEVDICVEDILNRRDVKPRPLHQDFNERSNFLPSEEKLVHSMAGLWRDETRRRKSRMPDADLGSSPFPPEVLISMSADPRNSQKGGWIHEDEYAAKIKDLVREECRRSNGRRATFDNIVKKVPLEQIVKTTFESVEDLFWDNLALFSSPATAVHLNGSNASRVRENKVLVDETRVRDIGDEDIVFDSDEDVAREPDLSQREQEKRGVDGEGELINQGDEESRPGGSNYAHQFPDSLDELPVTRTRSSGEKAKTDAQDSGTKRTDDSNTIRDLQEGSRGSSVSKLQRGPFEEDAEQYAGYRKRRKLSHDNSQSTLSTINATKPKMYDQVDSAQLSKPSNAQSDAAKGTFESSGKLTSFSTATKATVEGLPEFTSQESIKATGFGSNRTLSFPVVKDPHDPDTIQRLSQRSNSSQKSRGKYVSFQDDLSSNYSLSQDVESNPAANLNTHFEQMDKLLNVASNLRSAFKFNSAIGQVLVFSQPPPTSASVVSTIEELNIPQVIHQDAYYSNEKDVPDRSREYAGREFRLESNTVPYLADFEVNGVSPVSLGAKSKSTKRAEDEERYIRQQQVCKLRSWEIGESPPSRREVEEWIRDRQQQQTKVHVRDRVEEQSRFKMSRLLSQVDGPTQKNRHGFKFSQYQKSTSVQHEAQYMSLMSLEVHVNTRGKFVPNPEEDEISCVFWSLQSDEEDLESNGVNDGVHVGILALSAEGGLAQRIARHVAVRVEEEPTELDVINRMVDLVRTYDPDILTGYEVHGGSWGYLIERARVKYDYNLCDEFSRMKSQSHGRFGKDNDRWGFNHTSTIRVTGRHMINIWRAMRSELNLLQYTLENVAFNLLHRRIPHYQFKDLTQWYLSGRPADLAKVVDYYVTRVQIDLEILEENELVSRTSEQARLLGVDFFSVFSRGSQFKVESLMFRIAKPESFVLASPSRAQVGQQNALECLPLVMEPQSDFYNSPMLVLDFQSLYPSIMIAYNYCYSTFLGRIVNWRGQNKMGFTDYQRQNRFLELLQDEINIAPNGIMYVKPETRKSLLAKMLGEILETRVMVKSGMKEDKDDKTLQRLLNNRQLALKLIANVTYGYTSASFSGRMPCSEIADSIVQTARETLEKAIVLIHSEERWGAEVVYGDTDSLFVYLKGRSKSDAFKIGQEIASTITKTNPQPVKLKFEKVYLPCVLLAKKRYVGFKYESDTQTEPEFDAKGIETVRRDGTPAEQKIEEKALKILFRTADLSQVKHYFQQQCAKIMRGKVSVQDFSFAKEVKLGTYSDRGLPPPGAMISTKRMLEDPRAEPQYGERVPYVVITGAPGARLIDRCVAPEVLLQSDHIELDAEYYISKNLIPPLERIFNLVGANVRGWYDEMPKFQRIRRTNGNTTGNNTNNKGLARPKRTLEFYMRSSHCVICRERVQSVSASASASSSPLCKDCSSRTSQSLLTLRGRLKQEETRSINVDKVCRSCAGLAFGEEIKCDSKDCPVFYTRLRQDASLRSSRATIEPAIEALEQKAAKANPYDW